MQKTKLKIGDKVEVIAGRDVGKQGAVEKIDRVKARIRIQGINAVKKHVKSRGKVASGIITVNRPIAISNVMLVCPACNKRTRVKYEGLGKQKQRVCKQCEVVITETVIKK